MDDRTSGTAGAKRTSRRGATGAAPAIGNDTPASTSYDTSSASREDASTGGFMGRVRERASEQLNTQKNKATEGIGTAAHAVRQSTQQLRDQRHDTIAQYVESAADQLDRFASRLKEKNVSDLLEDAQRFARRQPALFIGGAFALGLLGSRFFKSSSAERQMDRMYGDDYSRRAEFDEPVYGSAGTVGTSGSADTFGNSDTSGPAGTRGTGTVSGTPRDLPGRETF